MHIIVCFFASLLISSWLQLYIEITGKTESIEWFIEGQASSRSYDSGEEPNHMTARKAGPLQIIQYSWAKVICWTVAKYWNILNDAYLCEYDYMYCSRFILLKFSEIKFCFYTIISIGSYISSFLKEYSYANR